MIKLILKIQQYEVITIKKIRYYKMAFRLNIFHCFDKLALILDRDE